MSDIMRIAARVARARRNRSGCDHCESALDEALAIIIEESREAVRPIIEAELEGERRAIEVMDIRLEGAKT